MKHWVRRSVVYFWRVLAIAIIALAVCIQLGRELSPLLDDLRPNIEQRLSRAIDANVTMGRLSASWQDLRPQLIIQDLRVKRLGNEPSLVVAKANLQLNILQTLMRGQLVWQHVVLNDVLINAEQSDTGDWNLAGFHTSRESGVANNNTTLGQFDPADLFVLSEHVALSHVSVALRFRTGKSTAVDIPTVSIQNNGDFHRLVAKAGIDESNEAFYFVLEGIGNPRNRSSFDASGFLQLKQFSIDKVIDAIPADTSIVKNSPWYQQQTLDAELWIDFLEPNRFGVNGNVHLSGRSAPAAEVTGDAIPAINALSATLVGDISLEADWALGIRDLNIDVNHQPLAIDQLSVHFEKHQKINVGVDQLDLKVVSGWLKNVLPQQPVLNDLVDQLSPSGSFNNLWVAVDINNPSLSSLSATIDNVDLGAWNNVPSFKHINGYVEVSPDHGAIYLDTENFYLHPESVYTNALQFDRAHGQISWFLRSQENSIIFNSGLLNVSGDFGQGNGYFFLDVPWVEKSRPSNFILQVGVSESSAEHYRQFMPKRVPEQLRSWMDKSIIGGDITQAGFIYRGRFQPDIDAERTLQLFVDVDDGELNYSDEWPALSALKGQVVLDNDSVNAQVVSAKIFDATIEHASVFWPSHDVSARQLHIQGAVQGSASDGLKIFKSPWLKRKVGDSFDQWRAGGVINADIALSVALLDNSRESKQSIVVSFNDNNLYLGKENIQLDNVSGQFFYDSQKGFSSKALKATLWQQPIALTVNPPSISEPSLSPTDYLQIQASGKADINDVAHWLKDPIMLFANGVAAYTAQLHIPLAKSAGQSTRLSIESDLVGVAIALPPPFTKAKDQPQRLTFSLRENELTTIDADIGRQFKLHIVSREDHPITGFLSINRPDYQHKDNPYFSIIGDIEFADSERWQHVFAQLQRNEDVFASTLANNSSVKEQAPKLKFELLFKSLLVDKNTVDDISIDGVRGKDNWRLSFNNDTAKGQVVWPDDPGAVIKTTLDYLRWDKAEPSSNGAGTATGEPQLVDDPWAQMDFSLLRPVDVDINNIYLSGKLLGKLHFKLRPLDNGVELIDIVGGEGELSLSGIKLHQGATFRWLKNDDGMSSHFTGTLRTHNVNDLLSRLALEPLLETKAARFSADVSWAGSPAIFAIAHLSGDLDVWMDNGRFIKGEGSGGTDFLRLAGLFNFDTWARRIRLDFSDLYKTGLSFDRVQGRLGFDHGIISLVEPLELKGPSSRLKMAGSIDYTQQELDTVLVATLPVGGNLTVVAALAAGLPAAAGVYLVSKIFRKQVDRVASLRYRMRGSWDNPEIEFEKLFDQSTSIAATEKSVDVSKNTTTNTPVDDSESDDSDVEFNQ